jgi:hypothetical protein
MADTVAPQWLKDAMAEYAGKVAELDACRNRVRELWDALSEYRLVLKMARVAGMPIPEPRPDLRYKWNGNRSSIHQPIIDRIVELLKDGPMHRKDILAALDAEGLIPAYWPADNKDRLQRLATLARRNKQFQAGAAGTWGYWSLMPDAPASEKGGE